MYYILSHPLNRSAKLLADKIGQIIGEPINVFTQPPKNNAYTCIVRYGNSFLIPNGDTQYNSPETIRLAGSKSRMSEFLLEKDFPHVTLFTGHPNKFPVAIRGELNANGGKGISIAEDENDFYHVVAGNEKYWSYWYDFKFELGVHILGGNIAKVFKKVRSDGLEEEKYPIRNTQRGYDFRFKPNWEKSYTGLEKYIKALYEIIPIQFARLDIGYVKGEGYKLIEINSAPGLAENKNTLNMYAEFLTSKVFPNN